MIATASAPATGRPELIACSTSDFQFTPSSTDATNPIHTTVASFPSSSSQRWSRTTTSHDRRWTVIRSRSVARRVRSGDSRCAITPSRRAASRRARPEVLSVGPIVEFSTRS
jgi:hypothetical protein